MWSEDQRKLTGGPGRKHQEPDHRPLHLAKFNLAPEPNSYLEYILKASRIELSEHRRRLVGVPKTININSQQQESHFKEK